VGNNEQMNLPCVNIFFVYTRRSIYTRKGLFDSQAGRLAQFPLDRPSADAASDIGCAI
jgi:hypothetical protein